jgi:histidinol-phosphate aminotransferase
MSTGKEYVSYFRPAIDAMSGYTPGEQPKVLNLIKLNTNENPYPPSPEVLRTLREFEGERLRLYPDPMCDHLRDTIAEVYGYKRENVITGNGSDDILTIAFRSFCDAERSVACLEPTYSLYPVLAGLQGTKCINVPLLDDFSMPENLAEQAAEANMLIITRPNAPTGNSFPKEKIAAVCDAFDGVVLIDEAYADFADDSCIDLAGKYENVIVSRTVSKSYSLAGLRLGFAVASARIIEGMMKVKDSYNVDMLTQALGTAAIKDQAYLKDTVSKIRASRSRLSNALIALGFDIVKSDTNFIFAAPPDGNGENFFKFLRDKNIIVRYFPGGATGKYVRITIGTDEQIDRLLEVTRGLYS